MIGRLSGILVEKNPPQILLDVQGVGYEIDVPMSTFYNLPATGERVVLFTHLVVREDAHLVFGFGSEPERRAFRQLVRISGVGARTALSVLSGLSVAELAQAVTMQDTGRLIKVPGIGKKTAERLVVELRGTWRITEPRPVWSQLRGGLEARRVKLKWGKLEGWDSALLLFVFEVRQWCRVQGAYCDLTVSTCKPPNGLSLT